MLGCRHHRRRPVLHGHGHRGLRGAKFSATTLAQVRRRGWAATAAEREPGVASVSAPVRGPGGRILAAVSVSGPIERLTRSPGRMHAPAVVAAGDRIRLHDLRHSYASAALAAGVPAKVVSERLGHANIGITMDTYSHVMPQLDQEAANKVASH